MAQIRDFRLTAVFAQSFLDRLHDVDRGQDWARLSDWHMYRITYNKLRGSPGDVPDLAWPWRDTGKSNFWIQYLGGVDPGGATAELAWGRIVPFRMKERPAKLATDNPGERVFYDCYGFPHGLALAITIQNRDELDLDQFVMRAREIGLDYRFRLDWLDGNIEQQLSLKTAGEKLLARYRQRYYGGVKDVAVAAEPVTIVTVVQGDGVPLHAPVDQALQRKLHAVAAWPQDWQQVNLPPLAPEKTLLPTKTTNSVAANCVYAAGRGRVVWLPSLFAHAPADAEKKLHKLSCFHHNLVASTAQTESLLGHVASWAAAPPAERAKVSKEAVTRTCDQLRALHGKAGSYRSWSARALIEEKASDPGFTQFFARGGSGPLK